MNELLLIAGMLAVTYGVRYPLLALAGRRRFPEPVIRALNYAPVAVLTAICAPMVLLPGGEWQVTPTNPWLLGAITSVLVSWRTRHLLATIAAGLVVFFAVRGLVG
jgi:branched-subunit amino acid transport protein